jgi:hypothetical protein
MKAYQFKIQIQDIQKPPVWRRILLPAHITFDQFHQIIQAAFGWEDHHLYQFSKTGWQSANIYKVPDEYDDDRILDSTTTFISEVFSEINETLAYIYDFGDNWVHKIILEEIADIDKATAICLSGKGACPPEDCGGAPGYNALIRTLNNPKDPDFKEIKNWLGLGKNETWDADTFDINEVNIELAKVI